MTEVAKLNQLLEEALENVPDELREELRNSILRAHEGELAGVKEELLKKADEDWRVFESSAEKVERKLQK